MSPSTREKAYARRRYEKWQKKVQVREAARRRRRNNMLAGLAAVAVVAVVVGIVMVVNSGDGSSTASPAPTPSTGASASASPTASADANNPCDAAPAAPADPQSFSKAPSPDEAKGKNFKVSVETSCGPMLLELDGAKAPQAVSSFVFLANKGYFDDTPCHRLTTDGIFVLQCGDPTGTGTGGPGYEYGPIENAPADGLYPPGTIAMARTQDPNSMGSQFFLVYKETTLPTEGGGYTIMGRITGGLDTVEKVAAGGVEGGASDGKPARAVSILSTKVEQG